jgi:RHS repeat-associated protein
VVEQLNTSTNTPTYLVQDQLGSTRLLVDTSGSVVGAFAFDVWGNPIVQGSSVPSPIGYAGGYTDSATGLIYLVNRYYDPVTGQFMSVDPDVASTLEPYGYVNDDPINESDSDGQLGCGFLWLGTCSANSVSTARPSPINGSSWNFSQAAGTPSQTTQPINLTLRLHSQVAVLVVDRTFLATGGIDVAICADDGSRGCYQLGLLYGQVSHPVNLPVDSTAAGDANYRYTVDAYQVSADDLFKPDPFDPSESANVPGLGMGCNGGDCEEDPFYGGGAGEDVQISQCAPRPSGATLLADYGPALDPTDFGTVVTWTGRKVSGPFQ